MKTAKEVYMECLQDYLGDDFNGEELVESPEWSLFEKAIEEYADQFKPKWISVKDRLPEEGVVVSLYGNWMQCTGILYEGRFHPDWNIMEHKDVTHWMPLIRI